MQLATKIILDEISIKKIDNSSNKPTIIFLHDSLGCIELWHDFPKKIGELTKSNVLIYDRQGYGKSCEFSNSKRDINYLEKEADILNELLDYWKIDNAILFGHSDGGSIALITAAKYPTKIKGIITEGAHVINENITIKGIQKAIQLYHSTNLKSKLEKYHGKKTEKMFWAWTKTWTSDEFKTWNIENFLPLIKCHSLIIQGEDDEYGTLNQVEKIITQTNGQSLQLIIPRTKHTPHKENPELILKKVSKYINDLNL